ncbi:hypothetical protein DFH08DRAFT_817281 [Mycena albidolilacea]|uniref:Uncharacterized protein n=1 Tax=Mycena albidolilacea TaxID=1033008 RepID=A0AAD6ZJL8_9AGAR|nr:hypothetical protein DFH08DRAFT_817281 [Mycena albidolilacea]
MSVWDPPLGLLPLPQLQRPSRRTARTPPSALRPKEKLYYKAYSEKLEQHLHCVWEERDFVAKKLENSQKAVSTLRQQASSFGRKLLECAGLESTQSVGAKEGAQEMLSILKQEMLYLGETLLEYTRLGPATDENSDLDNYIPFSILAT